MRHLLSAACLSVLALAGCDEASSTPPDPSTTTPAPSTSTPTASTTAAASTPGAEMSPDTVVASWDGGQITYGELSGKIRNQVTQMEVEFLTNRYTTELGALEQMMIEQLLEAEAEARGMSGPEELLRVEVEEKVSPPTEEEVQAFYEVVRRQVRNAPLSEVRPQVEGELLRRKQAERAQAYLGELKERQNSTTNLPYPDLPRIEVDVDDDPMLGSENAPVTIIQFAEYQCPYCGKAGEALDRVLEEYEGQVRMVYRDFPLSFHDRAVPAAVAANCAGEQGKYWEMHRKLMSNQRALSEQDLTTHAEALSLDMAQWNTCRQDPAQAAEVQADMEAGAAAGVTGTPAFFINGIMLSGALPYEQFKEIIDRELGRG